MKYLFFPVYALLAILWTLLELAFIAIYYTALFLWRLKRPDNYGIWRDLHEHLTGWDCVPCTDWHNHYEWDNTVLETLVRRLTRGDYKHAYPESTD